MKTGHVKALSALRKIVLITSLLIIAGSLIISCNKLPFHDKPLEVIYIQTNNYMKSQNAIIAYRTSGDGNLQPLPGGPFFTGGSGLAPTQTKGPFESDGEIKISNDKKFLLTVNSGDNTIAVFKIFPDGTLSLVPGAPFPSGGETPVSIDMWQQYVIVLNKSNNPLQPATQKPNYSVFTLQGDGTLTPVPGGKYELPDGTSPAQVVVSKTQPYVYGSNYFGYDFTPPVQPISSFTISNSGILTPIADNNPYYIPGQGGAVGLCHNWKYNHLYESTGGARFSLYGIDGYTGKLTFGREQNADVGCSRFCMDHAGNNLFTANSIRNSVSQFNFPSATEIRNEGTLYLKNPGPIFGGAPGSPYSGNTSSQCVSVATSANDSLLYVVSQHVNPDLSIGNYNYLHVVQLTGGWDLHEDGDPIQLPVPNNVRPRGIAVLKLN